MKRILFAGLVLLVVGCGGGGGSWTCNWQCTTNDTHGTKTYPAGPDSDRPVHRRLRHRLQQLLLAAAPSEAGASQNWKVSPSSRTRTGRSAT